MRDVRPMDGDGFAIEGFGNFFEGVGLGIEGYGLGYTETFIAGGGSGCAGA